MLRKFLAPLLVVFGAATRLHAGLITHNDYVAGTVITATAQNTNENAIVNEFNGNIESSNLKDGTIVNVDINGSAAISLSKLSLTDAVTFSSITVTNLSVSTLTVGGIMGTTAGGNANAGTVGEYVSSTTVAGVSVNSPSTAQFGDLLSISLTAGDWEIWAMGLSNYNSAANVTETQMGVSSSSGNSSTGLVPGDTLSYIQGTVNASNTLTHHVRIRVSISATTTYYLKYEAAFSGSNPQWRGSIKARRLR